MVEKVEPSSQRRGWLKILGPGLIAGASDDDPSGIATYSQVGAQFGYGMSWVMLFSFPLMAAIQEISARIGRVTGEGIAGNIGRHYPPIMLYSVVALLLIANIINLGADLGAMAEALSLLAGGPGFLYAALFGIICVAAEIFMSYRRYSSLLKWSTVALFAYVATALVVQIPLRQVLLQTFLPSLHLDAKYIVAIVAVLGTTISPYLFFWQSSLEAEDEREDLAARPLNQLPLREARRELERIRVDTYLGMFLSNAIGWFILVTVAATLNANGIENIRTSAEAAEALRPIAGDFAFLLFALGILGTGFLAVPVLAGSAAYAVAEALRWPSGLGRLPKEAKAFYGTIALATLIGVTFNLLPFDPIKALFWAAVLNGIVAVPIMAVMMLLARERRVMGAFILPAPLALMGWLATLIMAAVVVAMVATW
jgi:NRAMP (natural resistance-associated macrophage protein)-like metal ion transporter